MGKNCEAIILKGIDYRENDRILKLITLENGKVSAIARGARKAKSSLCAGVQPLTLGTYHLNPGRNMFTISQAEIICPFFNIKDSLPALFSASFMIDLTDSFLEENHSDEETYSLLKNILRTLDCATNKWEEMALFFEVNLLHVHGIFPDIYACVICGKTQTGKRIMVDPEHGGVLCSDCACMSTSGEKFSLNALYVLDKALKMPISEFYYENFSHKELLESRTIAGKFTSNYLGKDIKSRYALNNLS